MHNLIGVKAKDTITGCEGVITGRVEYLTGCNQFLLAPPVDKEGKYVEPMWFDDSRIEPTDLNKIKINEKKAAEAPGCCKAAPRK